MSGLHLNHELSWKDLLPFCANYKDPGIELPVGSCGMIHVNKKNEKQVQNRTYLQDKVCPDDDCKDSGKRVFRKNNKCTYSLPRLCMFNSKPRLERDLIQIFFFKYSFDQAVKEFAYSKRKTIDRLVNTNPDRYTFYDEVRKMLKDKHSDLASVKEMQEPCSWYFSSCELCHLFPILIEADELSTLLSFNDSEIRAVLTCDHGQHAGKNWTYLYYHLFDVYLYTNMIVACGLEQEPDKWGKMSPGSRFRSDLLYDNGAQTFLHSSRKYLADDVYIKDLNATRELCKNCFKYFYVTEMLENEVSIKLHKYDWYWLEYIEEKLSPGSLPWKVITPPTFEDSNCTWELYEEKLMDKFSLANVPEEMRVPALLDCISKETYAKISDLCSPLKPEEKSFKELLQILSSHFNIELGRNKFAERAKFHSRIQGDSESIEDFSSALKILANSCQYPESWIDEALTTQFIIGVKNDKLRQHLFAHETITFNQAVNFASTYEKDMISNSKLLDFKNKGQKNELDVGKVKTKKSNCKQPEEKNSCWRCLKSNHNDSNCSLKNAKCFQCSKIGHIKVACPLVSKSGLDKVNESDINHFL